MKEEKKKEDSTDCNFANRSQKNASVLPKSILATCVPCLSYKTG